jgi:hypothetical protein
MYNLNYVVIFDLFIISIYFQITIYIKKCIILKKIFPYFKSNRNIHLFITIYYYNQKLIKYQILNNEESRLV